MSTLKIWSGVRTESLKLSLLGARNFIEHSWDDQERKFFKKCPALVMASRKGNLGFENSFARHCVELLCDA